MLAEQKAFEILRDYSLEKDMRTKKALAILIFCFTSLPAVSKVENDFQQWSLMTVNKNLNDKWSLYFELQNRLGQQARHENLFFIRPAVHYKLNKYSSIGQGYAWVPNFSGDRLLNENRLWQQIDYHNKINNYNFFAWMRLEERFLEGTDSVSIRDRLRVGIKHPLFKLKTWKWIVFDELWINLNDVQNGPSIGIDESWIFTGVEKTFNKHVSANFGYMLNYLNRDIDQLQHAIRLHLNINL